MCEDNEFTHTLPDIYRDTFFFDPQGTSEYCCRLGYNTEEEIDTDDVSDVGNKTFLRNLDDVIQSDEVRCSQRGDLFDVHLKVIEPKPVVDGSAASSCKQKMVGSVHGRFFKHLVEKLHLKRPLQLQLTIFFDEPLFKTVVTEKMTLISDPREEVWPKAFKFEMELEGKPWVMPRTRTFMGYNLEVKISASPFIQSAGGLGIIPQKEDGETARMTCKFLEKRAHCDFTLLSGNDTEVRCHKMFLAESSPFFDRMIHGKMKEATENKCKLEASTKEGLEALLKFLYYRGVEDPLKSSVIAYELLDLGHKYDISRLEETMKGLLLAKLGDWWDLEVAINLFLGTRLMEDDEEWHPLKKKAREVLKMKSAELTSDSNTLLNDLMVKDPKGAKELIRLLSQQDD